MPAPQFALCHHQPGLGLVLLARHASHRACVALRLSELVDLVVESCLVGGQDTFADCLYLVDPGVSRVSGLEYVGYQRIEALTGTKRAPSRNTSAASSSS